MQAPRPGDVRKVELASIIVNLGIFVATLLAGIVAWRSVADAQEARDEAKGHEVGALRASRDAADAVARSALEHQRAADALERQADLAEKAAEKSAWSCEQTGANRWKITNTSGQNVDFFTISGTPDGFLQVEDGLTAARNMAKGQGVFVLFGGGLTDPTSHNVNIVWRDAARIGQESFFTIP